MPLKLKIEGKTCRKAFYKEHAHYICKYPDAKNDLGALNAQPGI